MWMIWESGGRVDLRPGQEFPPRSERIQKDHGHLRLAADSDTEVAPGIRFITNDTILHEVVERVGPWTGMWKLPVDEDTSAGYAALESQSGRALIVAYEYELPYRAAVILLPEYPFGPDDRIRAVYYRPPQRDEE